MNYSKKFNTTKKATAEIKRLEKECARLAKMDICDWSVTLEHHIKDKNKEIARLKSEIVQFRKTQDYQSDKIGELLEDVQQEVVKRKMCEVDLKNAKSINEGFSKLKKEFYTLSKRALSEIEKRGETIIRQANELTELKAGV